MKSLFDTIGIYLIEVVLFEKHFYSLFSYYEEESIYNIVWHDKNNNWLIIDSLERFRDVIKKNRFYNYKNLENINQFKKTILENDIDWLNNSDIGYYNFSKMMILLENKNINKLTRSQRADLIDFKNIVMDISGTTGSKLFNDYVDLLVSLDETLMFGEPFNENDVPKLITLFKQALGEIFVKIRIL